MNDLEAILTGQAPSIDPATDKIVRTVYGETGSDPVGQKAVAAVVMNRARQTGASPLSIITPDQFEAWAHPATVKRISSLSPSSPQYRAILSNIQPVLAGQEDPTNGADHYYAPKAQAQLGRPKPTWDNGSGQDIAGNRFFKLGYSQQQQPTDLLQVLGVQNAPATRSNAPQTAPAATQQVLQAWIGGGEGASKARARAPDRVDLNARLAPGDITQALGIKPKASQGSGGLSMPSQLPAEAAMGLGGVYNLLTDPVQRRAFMQGAAEVAHVANPLLDRIMGGVNPTALLAERGGQALATKMTGMPTEEQSRQAFPAQRREYQQWASSLKPSDRTKAGVAHFLGQSAASAPLMGGAGVVGGELGGALTTAVPQAAPFVNFLAGNATGNPLLRIASQGAQGAIQGAEGGLLTSGSSDRPVGQSVAQGAILGGVLGSAIGTGAEVVNGVRGALRPFTNRGREEIADQILAKFAKGGPTKIDAAEIIQGSEPTLAQATANPGIAGLERAMRNSPATGPAFAARDMAQKAARSDALGALVGDSASLDSLIEARAAAADPVRKAAFGAAKRTDPTPVVQKIDEILASPSGQRDVVVSALGNIRGKLVDAKGVPQTDPAQLYGIRSAVTDMLSPLAQGTAKDARLASSELMQVKNALDGVIEKGAPGYQQYLKNFAEGSRPVDEQKLLQSMNLTDSQGNLTLTKVDSAIKRIEGLRAKPGVNQAKSVSDQTLSSLYALRDDLRRAANSGLGRAVGSNTMQNALTGHAAAEEGAGLALSLFPGAVHHPSVGAPLAIYGALRNSQTPKIQDVLAEKLLQPSYAASAFRSAPGGNQFGRYLPPLGVLGFNPLINGGDPINPNGSATAR